MLCFVSPWAYGGEDTLNDVASETKLALGETPPLAAGVMKITGAGTLLLFVLALALALAPLLVLAVLATKATCATVGTTDDGIAGEDLSGDEGALPLPSRWWCR